jgi:hypothetical protein
VNTVRLILEPLVSITLGILNGGYSMKSSAIVFCFLLMASLFVRAQSTDEEIARAVMASPAAMAADAMVIRFSDDGSHETLREGSNGLICYGRSNEPGRGFSAQCTSTGNLARAAQNHKVRMASNNADEVRSMFESKESDGSREVPEFGSVWYSVNGQDRESANANRPHITIAVPFATGETLGLPIEGGYSQSGSWIMEAGTSAAHIMIPGS